MIRESIGRVPLRLGGQSRTHCLELRVNPFLRRSEFRAVQTHCSAVSDREITDTTKETLDQFIAWACANGVQGFGQADSQACLYVGSDGERGVLAQKPIPKGEIIVQAPLRIALADHPFDKESNELLPSDASWSTRLACRLLRECNLGTASLWYPYVSVLPQQVPTPVHWGEALVSRIKYQQAANHCFESHWVVESALSKLTGKAIGVDNEELTEEQRDSFRWACALVHSRTFATAAQDGGVGVRVMVPVLDMFNHAGDEVRNLLTSRSRACDNCRWQAVAPENNSSNEWVMQVIATADILEGDELCFSYGERSNDDFFVHYGFVPLRNPRDEVILFESIESALDWYALESGLPVAVGPPPAAAAARSDGNGTASLPALDSVPDSSNAWSGMGGEVVPRRNRDTPAAGTAVEGAVAGGLTHTDGGSQTPPSELSDSQSAGLGAGADGPSLDKQTAADAAADAEAAAAALERRCLVDALRQIALETHAQMDMRLEEEGIFEKPGQGPPLGPNDPRRLAVRAGCYVTPELMTMFEKVAGGQRGLAEAAVARRAWALLRDWGGEGLRQDLALLAVHAAQHGRSTAEDSEERFWEFLLVHYHEAIPGFCKANGILLKADVTELQEIPTTDINPKELVEAYMKTAGESSVRPISYNEYLVSTLMANKSMILWDVLLSGKGLALDVAELGPLRV